LAGELHGTNDAIWYVGLVTDVGPMKAYLD